MNPSGFTFSKILSGAYKTLTLANQIIPLYKEVSPMVKNARNAFSVIKEFNKGTKVTKTNNIKTQKQNINNSSKTKKELQLNNPVFFH